MRKIFLLFKEFCPARFESTRRGNNPSSYVPFGIGPRSCPGQKIAMLELRYLQRKNIFS